MENNICVSSNQLIFFTIIFIIFIIYIILYYNKKNNKYLKKLYKYKSECNDKDHDNDNDKDDINKIIKRDNLVLSDNLYPPLNRYPLSERNIIFNNHTRDSQDTYHLVGNLTRLTDNFQMLLFGRLKCRGCNSEFYASPADKNLSNIKIKIEKLKDIYNLPNEIIIDDIYPGNYKLTELKYPDNQSIYY